MCGIAALFAYHSDAPAVQERELNRIRDHMRARGPDGEGSWFDARRRIGLAHRRLAIIDLSSGGAQPMHYPERGLVITFNGEIYNYQELKKELETQGHHFQSQSDTEVLLHLYAEHGRDMLNKLRGMYAFAIWDNKRQELFLARDPFGIKPIYYSDDGKMFRAASQVKALLTSGEIDLSPSSAGHVGYFLWGHVPEPYTLYQNIRSLPAGSSMTITKNGAHAPKSFCSISNILAQADVLNPQLSTLNSQLVHSQLRSSLLDSIRHHLIADVPVGVFLSSGIDSTTLTALAAELGSELRTVTLAFEEFKGTADDETPLAEEVAKHYGARHQTISIARKDFEDELQHLLDSMDQPTNDGVNSFFISRAAAQAGLKVAISGLGGDELFGGYPSFTQIPKLVRSFSPLQPLGAFNRSVRVVSTPFLKRFTSPKYAGLLEYGGTYGGAYLLRRGMFMPWELPELLDPDMVREGWNELQPLLRLEETIQGIHSPHLKVSALEMNWYMRNQLLRDTDWASMAYSLEIRVPLVDVSLWSRVSPLLAGPSRPGKQDMARTPHSPLPSSILTRPKTGFNVPVRDWLLHAFDPSAGRERGLRGWAREVYSTFADSLLLHRATLRHKRKLNRSRAGFQPVHPKYPESISRNGTLPHHPETYPATSANSSGMDEDNTKLSLPKKLRILVLLTDGFGGFGGISKFNCDFLKALASHPATQEIIVLPRLMEDTAEVIPAKVIHDKSALGGKKHYMKAVIRNARKLRDHSGITPLIICSHINLLPAARLARFIAGGSLHLIVYGVDAWKPTKNPLANACVGGIDGFISISNFTKRRFLRWTKLRENKGMILPCCVDLSAFSPGRKPEVLMQRYHLHGKKILMTLGRLASEERYKGFDEVIEVLPRLGKQIPNLAYLICGDGPDRARLVQKARSLDLRVLDMGSISSIGVAPISNGKGASPVSFSDYSSSIGDSPVSFGDSPKESVSQPSTLNPQLSHNPIVIFTGKIPESEKADHYRLADLYVMPSSGEGFGIVFLEALASGLPVIGSKADASREALMGGKLGALVDPRDPDEILTTIVRLLNQPEERNGSKQNLDSITHFSDARFEQRVHTIIEAISG